MNSSPLSGMPGIQRQLALLTLLGDDDPAISDGIRAQLIAGGQGTLDWLENHRYHDEPSVRRRIREIFQHFAAAKADTEFLSFVLAHGEHFDLEHAVWLFVRTRYPETPVNGYRAQLDEWAAELRPLVRESSTAERKLQHINQVLYEKLGFKGNAANYYDSENSYLNRVMDRRRGIPISLCLLYLFLTQRLDLPVTGIGMPGHFLCRYQTSREEFYIDAFHDGQLLTKIDCRKRLKDFAVDFDEAALLPISSRRILQRVVANLHLIHQEAGERREGDRLQRYLMALAH
jgi:regulator of sirC expression with transglutaminase-like and TPR domain